MKNSLLVPGVFFLNFFVALLFFSFFGGLAQWYSMTVAESNTGLLLLLCVVKSACYGLIVAAIVGIIAVYNFLMRHRSKIPVAIILFILCLIFTLIVIIPACYAQMDSIKNLMARYTIQPVTDTALIGFLDRPAFIASFMQDVTILFEDLYGIYREGFFHYVFFSSALFVCICTLWIACIATRWNMINLLLLFLFARMYLFLYPYLHHPITQSVLRNVNIHIEKSLLGIPPVLIAVAIIVHLYGGLKLLLLLLKTKKRRAA